MYGKFFESYNSAERCKWAEKCAFVLSALEKRGYKGEEITKKEFKKMGLPISLEYFRTFYYDKDRKHIARLRYHKNKNADPYCPIIKLSRSEEFLVSKSKSKKEKNQEVVIVSSKNIVVPNVSPKQFQTDALIHDLVVKAYGECEVKNISMPIVGKRYYYVIDMDILHLCAQKSEEMVAYHLFKVNRLEKQIEKEREKLKRLSQIADNLI